jgi:predicted transcriptional regulator
MKEVHKIVNDDSQGTISEIAGRLGLSHGTCKGILRVDLKVLQITSIALVAHQ